MGADTTPSGRTVRIVPLFSVTRKLPSGRNWSPQGAFRRFVIVSTVNFGDGFDGAGASVCPAKAGLGLGAVAGCPAADAASSESVTVKNAQCFMGCILSAI